MAARQPGLEIVVCSGLEVGHVQAALGGAPVGTRIFTSVAAGVVSV
jgi:hypothetical protein